MDKAELKQMVQEAIHQHLNHLEKDKQVEESLTFAAAGYAAGALTGAYLAPKMGRIYRKMKVRFDQDLMGSVGREFERVVGAVVAAVESYESALSAEVSDARQIELSKRKIRSSVAELEQFLKTRAQWWKSINENLPDVVISTMEIIKGAKSVA